MSVLVDKGKEPLCCSSFSAVASVNDFFFKIIFFKERRMWFCIRNTLVPMASVTMVVPEVFAIATANLPCFLGSLEVHG